MLHMILDSSNASILVPQKLKVLSFLKKHLDLQFRIEYQTILLL